MAKVIVTGGCGYIGSHTIVELLTEGYEVVSVDNLSNSSLAALDHIESLTGVQVKNYPVDLCDARATRDVFAHEKDASALIHFAAYKAVGESIREPWKYYYNNLNAQLNVLNGILENGIRQFVFSSSCAVYGDSDVLPVTENLPFGAATSPYGRTKQIGEQMSEDILRKSACRRVYLRYFNPVGAHPSGKIGEAPGTALNLVPIITETAIGAREGFTVFGSDYPTPDGTCVRDYIHVVDVARAHVLALQYLEMGKESEETSAFNLGLGYGLSVLELIAMFERVSGVTLNYTIGPRREGDVAEVYGDPAKAKEILGWSPTYTLEDMMRTAWQWEQYRQTLVG